MGDIRLQRAASKLPDSGLYALCRHFSALTCPGGTHRLTRGALSLNVKAGSTIRLILDSSNLYGDLGCDPVQLRTVGLRALMLPIRRWTTELSRLYILATVAMLLVVLNRP